MRAMAAACAALLALSTAATSSLPATEPVPGDSLYQMPLTLTTSARATLRLPDLRGPPLLVTMFYSHCTSVCPLLTTQLQRLVSELRPAERAQIRVLMVSFDATRDTPEVLTAFAAEHRIEESNWIVARASAHDVRALAAALGIRYRELADHTFNHSVVIAVTDRDGVIRGRTSRLAGPDADFLRAVRAQLTGGAREP